ncbi:uncharacterized protein MONOS_14555 [Monocercomonoides exilis]|uniref:uncharacterized protein n=1 Tax=Monocercomonoides exilis TaxID=2049356 RepID=UPI00355A7454|nr:hypothetical protein MONOS_14555 [Monocercomonoides exilis]|eukprot:MONOS_14555.1-p1 / transcript=MONOS_14555.1 / gene=MONOS_14555 / organism=Monocercomonoides_exilis_PA203 / gene_product=unspecified product / transcript_product=unspecified product / location=Mono_scaffold01024:4102-4766(-) / protein_length=131 / sequence_SO=supercontig / SO=protein_coding / is_pseudo=false
MSENFQSFSESIGKEKIKTTTGYEKPVEIDDVPFVEYPVFIKILWKRERTLKIDYAEKKLILLDKDVPRLTIAGKQLKKLEADRSDPTAIRITYLTGNPKEPQQMETIYAESKEQRPVVLRDLGDYLRGL